MSSCVRCLFDTSSRRSTPSVGESAHSSARASTTAASRSSGCALSITLSRSAFENGFGMTCTPRSKAPRVIASSFNPVTRKQHLAVFFVAFRCEGNVEDVEPGEPFVSELHVDEDREPARARVPQERHAARLRRRAPQGHVRRQHPTHGSSDQRIVVDQQDLGRAAARTACVSGIVTACPRTRLRHGGIKDRIDAER